jgi:hypothetical protein
MRFNRLEKLSISLRMKCKKIINLSQIKSNVGDATAIFMNILLRY